ncbi:hypothetical protein [Lyngbya sp. CCY1209]|uniref:hypothetical protein n=1 Tax=Lyngbya sp. CCY1209 TaxID=2886103 RepID=UPI002D210CC5|nr:hypothetical protein [Lyngbya sp. CCY1209]MEB3881981.1 hypothetical protein [Lyngbya sp. CCY1209]
MSLLLTWTGVRDAFLAVSRSDDVRLHKQLSQPDSGVFAGSPGYDGSRPGPPDIESL